MKVLIEAVAGSREKRSYDEERLVYRKSGETLLPYPYPYGFILGTRTPEGDGVDCYIITEKPLVEGTIVSCTPRGMLEFFEESEEDHKVLATLPDEDPLLDGSLRERLVAFIYGIFRAFPEMQVRVGELLPAEAAKQFIRRWRV